MAYIKAFESDNNKYTRKECRIDSSNPDFTPSIEVTGKKEKKSLMKNQKKWAAMVGYMRWFPDIWYDLITPETGGIKLGLDQRVFLRSVARFPNGYYVYPRGWSKTLLEVMAMFHAAVFYPRVHLAMTAQSLKNAASLLKAKYMEIINYYPLIKEEIYSVKFNNDESVITFHNGSIVDVLSNTQSSKGQRRDRGSIEEDAQVNEQIFNDALRPVFNVPRRTIGKRPIQDPFENCGAINAFTTSWYRNSPAYYRCLNAYNGMINLDGSICLGATWKLAVVMGRGRDINEILKDKKRYSPYEFDMNYMSKWTGSGDDGICSIAKLMDCRNLKDTQLVTGEKCHTILSVDVARSDNDGNCQTVICVLNIIRFSNGRVKEVRVPNMIAISGKLNYTAQGIEVKRAKEKYSAEAIIVDNNGLGKG